MATEWLALLPLLLLATGGTAIFCLGAFGKPTPPAALFGLAIATCLACGASGLAFPVAAAPFAGLACDAFSAFYAVLFAALSLLTLLISYQYARGRNFAGDEFFGIVLFAAAGMLLIAGATHWLLFFLGLEMLSISLYVLIAIRRGEGAGIEAAVKYFTLGAVASGFVVFGIALLYGATGTLELRSSLELAAQADNRLLGLFGLGLILVGLGFKLSLVPFHLWTPDVYQGAPAPITAFLATGSKVAVLALFVRLAIYGGEGIGALLAPALWTMAALTMVVGNLTALAQTRIKRMLAYSSIAQMGYMLMALLAVNHQGAAAVMFSSAVYALMDLGAFGTVGLLSPGEADRDRLADYRGLGYTHPGRAALLTLCLFSLAGLPATAGFIGKFVLFRAALAANLVGLALLGILTAMVSLYFYLNVVVVLYMRPAEQPPAPAPSGKAANLACLLLALTIFWLGVFPGAALTLAGKIVEQLALR